MKPTALQAWVFLLKSPYFFAILLFNPYLCSL